MVGTESGMVPPWTPWSVAKGPRDRTNHPARLSANVGGSHPPPRDAAGPAQPLERGSDAATRATWNQDTSRA